MACDFSAVMHQHQGEMLWIPKRCSKSGTTSPATLKAHVGLELGRRPPAAALSKNRAITLHGPLPARSKVDEQRDVAVLKMPSKRATLSSAASGLFVEQTMP
jgi:hypothetical protein